LTIFVLIFTFRGNDFRKDFKGLNCLKVFFPSSPTLTLSATAPPQLIMKLKESLCLSKDYKIFSKNPNRENIFLDRQKRASNNYGYESYDIILRPIAALLRMNVLYPLTIIYMKLKYCGYAYVYAIKFYKKISTRELKIFLKPACLPSFTLTRPRE
jgi:hypothetical protein